MTNRHRDSLALWTLLAIQVVWSLGVASVAHLVTANLWESIVRNYVWYNLSATAIAIGCWIAFGDGAVVPRLAAASFTLACAWTVWQASIYVAAIWDPGSPGSTSEGFSVYATGNAIIALAVTVGWVGAFRWLTGLRLVRDPALGPLIVRSGQFTLGEFFGGVTMLAALLGMWRLIAPQDSNYFVWFKMPRAVLGFIWGWTYITVIAVPTALLVVYARRYIAAASYFSVLITAIVLYQRWKFVGRMPFSAWRFCWLLEAANVLQVVVAVAVLLAALKWTGYELSRKPCRDGHP